MKVLRTIGGVTRLDRLKNEQIRTDLNVEPVLITIERERLRWYGHVMRMDESRIPRRYLQWRPQGKRPVGRPRKRWLDGVEEALNKRGTTLAQVEEKKSYEDRAGWRSVVLCLPTDR